MDILKLTLEDQVKFLSSFDQVFIGCDGTLWQYTEPIPNVGEAVMLLKETGKSCKYITNNSMHSEEEIVKKLEAIGITDTLPEDIVQPIKCVVRYIEDNLNGQPIFSLCSRAVNTMLIDKGVKVETMDNHPRVTIKNIRKIVQPTSRVGAVLIDTNLNLKFSQLARAQKYLEKDDCKLLVAAADRLVPISASFTTIGCDGFVKLLAESTRKLPIQLGKPGELLYAHIKERFTIPEPERVLFIGDSLEMDVRFGNECGFQTLLVLTGAWNMEKFNISTDQFKPKYIASSLADFIKFFEQMFTRSCKPPLCKRRAGDKSIHICR